MAVRVSSLTKKLQLLCHRQLGTIIIIYELNTFDNLVMILLNYRFCTIIALIIKLIIADLTDVFDQVLSQTMNQSFNTFSLSQLLHQNVLCLNALIVVKVRNWIIFPFVTSTKAIQSPRILSPFINILGLLHFLSNLHAFVL